MNLNRLLLGCSLLLLTVSSAWAQQTITGTVTDKSRETLIGANVVAKENPSVGVITDFDGNYTITVPDDVTTLVFSYIGFENLEEPIDGRSQIDVKLGDDSFLLNDVVISASKRKEKVLDAPASVSIITAERIENQSALTAVDNLKKTPGVDVMTTGLVSSNVNIRGFNDIFSGSMLTMVDNRIGRVPSLRVNAFQLIPGNNYDIAKMEVVRGPGAALYGPNAADGVLHIITKSPIDQDKFNETTVSLTSGFRQVTSNGGNGWSAASGLNEGDLKTVFSPEVRTSFKFSDKVGLKVSGKYMAGQDWENYDVREPAIGDPFFFGSVENGAIWGHSDTTYTGNFDDSGNEILAFDTLRFDRDFGIQNWNADTRLDLRPNDDTEIVFSGGLSSSKNLELTGLGAAQTLGWQYWYAQARMRYKNLFVQYFVNSSNSGEETFLIPQSGALEAGTAPHQFQLLTDRSKLHTVQAQHSSSLMEERLQLIYGLDLLMTRPDTEGSINGRFEDRDNFNQYGAYIQGDYKFNEQWKAVAAVRADYHSLLEEFQVSPRVGMTYKPTPKQTLRATYNRAFSTPSSLGTSLDLANGIHPFWNGTNNPQGVAMNIRGIGNYNGYTYDFNEQGELLYNNFWDGQQYTVGNNGNNAAYLEAIIDIVESQLANEVPEELASFVPLLSGLLFDGIESQNSTTGASPTIDDVDVVGVDFVELVETGDYEGSLWNGNGDLSSIKNRKKVSSTITQTWEVGWKGIISNRLFANVDVYYTRKSNYQSPLVNVSPFITFDPVGLQNAIGDENGLLAQNIVATQAFLDNIPSIDFSIADLLENNENYLVEANGDGYDELNKILMDAASQIGVGNATPENADGYVEDDIILTYINLGTVDLWGFDIGGNYLLKQNGDMQLGFSYSYLSTDRVELDGAGGGFLGINTPQHKVSLSWDQIIGKTGFSYGLNFRAQNGFPANSAIYIDDDFPGFYNLDTRIGYSPRKSPNTLISLEVQNTTDLFLDNEYRTFPGTPFMGAIAMLKLKHTF